MRINHNISALNAYRNLSVNNSNTSKSLEKLSSGLRINRAADDAAGLAISEKMRSQIRGLDMAERNVLDGISFVQTAEGALSSTHAILQRIRELAVQAANDSNTDVDREAIQKEVNQLTNEINRIGNTTEFNKKKLLNGDLQVIGGPAQIKAGSTSGSLGNQVSLGANGVAGKYSVEITDATVPGTNIQNLASQTDTTTNATLAQTTDGSDIGLAQGSYTAVVASSSAKNTANVGNTLSGQSLAGTSVFQTAASNKPITVDAGSTLNGTGYYVQVDKVTNETIASPSPAIGGISNLSAGTAPEGAYTITTGATVSMADAAGNTLVADRVITGVRITNNSNLQDSGNYQITLTQGTPAADSTDKWTFTLDTLPGSTPIATSVDITTDSGATTIQLGDISFDVDLAQLRSSNFDDATLNSVHHNNVLELTIGNQVTVEQTATGAKVTQPLAPGATTTPLAFDFSTDGGSGQLTLDAEDTVGNPFARGIAPTTTNIVFNDVYTIGLYDSANNPIGSSKTLLESNLATPLNLTNIQLGLASDGVFVDLAAAGLNSMADNETVSMDFNVTNNVERTVQVKDSSNNSVTGMFVLDNTGSTEITGTGLKLNFDPSTIANGTIGFNVDDITPNDFKMTLKEDTDGDGLFESTVVNAQSFNKGDLVSLGATGINVQTSNSTSVSDSALFEIENVAQDNSATMQIGANAGQTVSLELKDMRAKALQISTDLAGGGEQTLTLLNGSSQTVWFTEIAGVNDGVSNNSTQYALDISTNEKAQAAIIAADDAIQRVSEERSRMGALQNRLEYTVDNLKYMNENLTASESRIRDLDMAEEMTKFTKNNILNQAAQAMLAQANQLPQGVLQLLK